MSNRNRNQRRMPRPQPKTSNYVPKLLAQAAPYLEAGTVVQWRVAHDGWCNLLNRRGACNCDPDIEPIGHAGPYGAASGRN